MYVYMCVCVCVYVCMCMHVCVYVCMCGWVGVNVCMRNRYVCVKRQGYWHQGKWHAL